MRTNLLNPFGPRVVLASRSARRRELLTLVGAHFDCFPVEVDESPLPEERAEAHVLRLAETKARAALERGATRGYAETAVVLGADTIVSIDREILGKPGNQESAGRMLRRLSGRVHEVWTGISLVHSDDGRAVTQAVRSIVKFARLDDAEIERYVATGAPKGQSLPYDGIAELRWDSREEFVADMKSEASQAGTEDLPNFTDAFGMVFVEQLSR